MEEIICLVNANPDYIVWLALSSVSLGETGNHDIEDPKNVGFRRTVNESLIVYCFFWHPCFCFFTAGW